MNKKKIDWLLLLITILLVLLGIVLIYSASCGIKTELSNLASRQTVWMAIGIFLLFLFIALPYRNLRKASYPLYLFSLLLLLLVLLIGKGRAGSSRWLTFGGFYFQPSEFAKLIFILVAARYLADIGKKVKRFFFLIPYFLLVGIPFLLILKQPNLGTALVLLPISLGILWTAGIRKKHLTFLIAIGFLSSPILWFTVLKDYQRARLLVFINPNADPLGSGYNVIQSKIAIGSGGLFGKGFLRGTQSHLAFLPEYHTDFIFCVLAEEWGFIGGIVLLFLYSLFLKSLIRIATSTSEPFARLVATGITVMFASHIFINIGMTLGMLPVAGLPLPFLSYGGSSLLIFLIAVGIVLNIKKKETMF
ncbi:MAG: rod shape-determining protein RodA [Candidatus Omnitrophica bacterium]|nr:rod shape-determining protein RodA [Candidatus Omnitrophota bacterium]